MEENVPNVSEGIARDVLKKGVSTPKVLCDNVVIFFNIWIILVRLNKKVRIHFFIQVLVFHKKIKYVFTKNKICFGYSVFQGRNFFP